MNEKLTQPWNLPMHAKTHVFACTQKKPIVFCFPTCSTACNENFASSEFVKNSNDPDFY